MKKIILFCLAGLIFLFWSLQFTEKISFGVYQLSVSQLIYLKALIMFGLIVSVRYLIKWYFGLRQVNFGRLSYSLAYVYLFGGFFLILFLPGSEFLTPWKSFLAIFWAICYAAEMIIFMRLLIGGQYNLFTSFLLQLYFPNSD